GPASGPPTRYHPDTPLETPMKAVLLPPEIERALEMGAALAVSVSGGKDSQAMLLALVRLHRERGFTGELFAVHADLGRIEWDGTSEQVQQMCRDLSVPLRIVTRSDGRDMIDHWIARGERLESQGKQPRPW